MRILLIGQRAITTDFAAALIQQQSSTDDGLRQEDATDFAQQSSSSSSWRSRTDNVDAYAIRALRNQLQNPRTQAAQQQQQPIQTTTMHVEIQESLSRGDGDDSSSTTNNDKNFYDQIILVTTTSTQRQEMKPFLSTVSHSNMLSQRVCIAVGLDDTYSSNSNDDYWHWVNPDIPQFFWTATQPPNSTLGKASLGAVARRVRKRCEIAERVVYPGCSPLLYAQRLSSSRTQRPPA